MRIPPRETRFNGAKLPLVLVIDGSKPPLLRGASDSVFVEIRLLLWCRTQARRNDPVVDIQLRDNEFCNAVG